MWLQLATADTQHFVYTDGPAIAQSTGIYVNPPAGLMVCGYILERLNGRFKIKPQLPPLSFFSSPSSLCSLVALSKTGGDDGFISGIDVEVDPPNF